ncbi:hypothetical protein GGI12_000639 [Dipsacomyces acuminosporus]|nr:hypothetical protein GGI12_000639 [Dipsacomyces acuminosporus]
MAAAAQLWSQQQLRMYGSKKKGGSKKGGSKKHTDDDEEGSEPAEMTLDMDKMAEQMKHSVKRFSSELQALRAGRANPAMLDHIRVLLKGGSAVLSDLAMISIKDAQNLIIIPNSDEEQKAIEASIRNAGLGLNPRIDKNAIVVPVPKPTKESREKLLKSIGAMAEHARVHVRKHRQDAMKKLKADSKHSMPKDEVKAWEKDIQTETDKHIAKIEELLKAKHREAYNGTSTGTSAKVQDETGTQTPFADAAASSISTASSPTTTATATTAVSTGSTPFISPAAANTLPNGPSLRHNSIFELGGEPFGDQASGGSMTPSSRLSRIVGAANGAAPLSSANSPAALHPLGSIGSPHSFFSDAYTASQTPSGAAPNTSVGHGPSASSLTQLHAPSKRLSQSRFTSVLGDASSLSSGISRGGDKAVGAIPPGGGPNSSALDLKQGGFDSIQSQQASPNVVAQTGFSDFFVKSLPVSRRNSREFQNLWQELEGFSINDGPAQPVNISSGIPPHLSGYDGHSIAAHSSSGAFRSAADSLALGTSPKLPHGLLDDDMLSVRPNPASDASTPANPTKLANGAARGSNSKHPSDALQAATAFVSSGANSSNSSSNANSSFMAGRSSFSAYTRDARVTNASTSGLSTVAAALDSMAPQKNTTADLMLNDAARDMRLYDSSRGVNLIRNASTPVLNTKQYQVIQPVGELSALQPPARGIAPSNGFAAESGNMSIYDASGFVYNGGNNNNGSSNSSNGGQHHGAPQIGVGDLSYALAGSRVQPAAANYPYVMNPASGIGGRNQQQPFIPPGPASGSATPIAGGYGLSTPLVPGLPYGLGPQNPQLSVPHTPLQHAHHPASHIHMQQQQQQQQQLQQMQQASQQPQVLSTQGQSQSQIQPQPQTQVATHRHGCCVFQRCIDFASSYQKGQLVKEVIDNALKLVQDPFGNYVVQYVLDLGNTDYTEPLIRMFVSHICGLSVQKFSSNVMEKCIRLASPATRKQLVAPLLHREKLDTLMRDSYGNYVVQTALDFADPQQRAEIIDAIVPLLASIRHTPYGKRIYIKLQRDGFVSAVPSAAGSRHASPTLGPSIGSHSAAALTNMAHYPVSIGPAMLAPNGVSMAAAAAGSALSRGVSPTAGNSTSSSSLPPPSLGQGRAYVPANASGGGATALDQAGLSSFHQALSFQQQQQQQQQQQGMHPGGMYMYKMASHDPAALHSQMYQAPGAAAHHLLTPAHPGSSNGIHERPAIASSGPSSSVPASSAPSAATSDASRLQASSHYGAL